MFPKQIRLVDEKVLDKVRGMGCCICGQHPVDPSHIRSKGSGGPDTLWNVVPHCRRHHTEWHTRGWRDFTRRNPAMAIVLNRLGWKTDAVDLWHDGLAVGEFSSIKEIASDKAKKKRPTSSL